MTYTEPLNRLDEAFYRARTALRALLYNDTVRSTARLPHWTIR